MPKMRVLLYYWANQVMMVMPSLARGRYSLLYSLGGSSNAAATSLP